MNSREMSGAPEHNRAVEHAWLFDVDGVITHPEQKKVTEPDILDQIIKRLEAGEPVALVTGRSLEWMVERVVEPLEQKITDKSVLGNFFAVGEKGGAWLSYSADFERVEAIDQSISVPDFLQAEIRGVIRDQFSQSMFFDDTKRTMISTEMKDNVTVSEYEPEQLKLEKILRELLEKYQLSDRFKVDPTRIATDVENKHVGKALGSGKVLEWLESRKIKPQNFITFGDSKSDVPMAEHIHNQGFPVTLVFVGGRKLLEGRTFAFPVVFTANECEKGTLEYLREASV